MTENDYNIGFEKNTNFFRRKLAKLEETVIITSTPGLRFLVGTYVYVYVCTYICLQLKVSAGNEFLSSCQKD
jgi:hypothetical protein